MILYSECSVAYRHFSGVSIPSFATGVMNGVWEHPLVFDPLVTPAPPSTKAHFLQLINAVLSSYAEYDAGGLAQKSAFVNDYNLLIVLLDQYAVYVNEVAKGAANVILVSGFTPIHNVPATKSVVPGQPTLVTITNGAVSGTLEVECDIVGHYSHYGCIACEGHALPDGLQIINESTLVIPASLPFRMFHNYNTQRKKVFTGLTKGVEYYFYFYVYNTAGVGPLSVVVSKSCS